MNRNNTVSVIEVAVDDPHNTAALNRSFLTSTESEIQLSITVSQSNLPASSEATESVKALDSQEDSPALLNDKIVFKKKMNDILSCRVCAELRRCPMYQCKYGHLICAGCFNDILAESHIQNEIASCPKCQTTITKDLCFRNIAVERTISELPVTCPYCHIEFPPENFRFHETLCRNRPTTCSNSVIGCSWQGPNSERELHEQQCLQPSASGYEILKSLAVLDQQQKEEIDMYNNLMELLSVEKISYTDLQLKHCKTENENIIFETFKFTAFDNQWMLRACCFADSDKNINVSYQLHLKTKIMSPMNMQYTLLRGPYNDMDIKLKIYQFKFSDKAVESHYQTLDLPKSLDKETFHSAKRINIRIIMFALR